MPECRNRYEARAKAIHDLADQTEIEALRVEMQALFYGEKEIESAIKRLRLEQAKGTRRQSVAEFKPEDYYSEK